MDRINYRNSCDTLSGIMLIIKILEKHILSETWVSKAPRRLSTKPNHMRPVTSKTHPNLIHSSHIFYRSNNSIPNRIFHSSHKTTIALFHTPVLRSTVKHTVLRTNWNKSFVFRECKVHWYKGCFPLSAILLLYGLP